MDSAEGESPAFIVGSYEKTRPSKGKNRALVFLFVSSGLFSAALRRAATYRRGSCPRSQLCYWHILQHMFEISFEDFWKFFMVLMCFNGIYIYIYDNDVLVENSFGRTPRLSAPADSFLCTCAVDRCCSLKFECAHCTVMTFAYRRRRWSMMMVPWGWASWAPLTKIQKTCVRCSWHINGAVLFGNVW